MSCREIYPSPFLGKPKTEPSNKGSEKYPKILINNNLNNAFPARKPSSLNVAPLSFADEDEDTSFSAPTSSFVHQTAQKVQRTKNPSSSGSVIIPPLAPKTKHTSIKRQSEILAKEYSYQKKREEEKRSEKLSFSRTHDGEQNNIANGK